MGARKHVTGGPQAFAQIRYPRLGLAQVLHHSVDARIAKLAELQVRLAFIALFYQFAKPVQLFLQQAELQILWLDLYLEPDNFFAYLRNLLIVDRRLIVEQLRALSLQDHFFVPTGHECAGIAKTLLLGSRASCPRAKAKPQSKNRSPAAKVGKRTPNGDFGMALLVLVL